MHDGGIASDFVLLILHAHFEMLNDVVPAPGYCTAPTHAGAVRFIYKTDYLPVVDAQEL
jgi:hypothetical protein